jgi:hypothetical protein
MFVSLYVICDMHNKRKQCTTARTRVTCCVQCFEAYFISTRISEVMYDEYLESGDLHKLI